MRHLVISAHLGHVAPYNWRDKTHWDMMVETDMKLPRLALADKHWP
jgi:hypothetical protein